MKIELLLIILSALCVAIVVTVETLRRRREAKLVRELLDNGLITLPDGAKFLLPKDKIITAIAYHFPDGTKTNQFRGAICSICGEEIGVDEKMDYVRESPCHATCYENQEKQ